MLLCFQNSNTSLGTTKTEQSTRQQKQHFRDTVLFLKSILVSTKSNIIILLY